MALLMLCKRIESFVKNPLFETPGVLDVQHSTKASSDLESILRAQRLQSEKALNG